MIERHLEEIYYQKIPINSQVGESPTKFWEILEQIINQLNNEHF